MAEAQDRLKNKIEVLKKDLILKHSEWVSMFLKILKLFKTLSKLIAFVIV